MKGEDNSVGKKFCADMTAQSTQTREAVDTRIGFANIFTATRTE